MKPMKSHAILLGAPLILAACAVDQCGDPRTDGLGAALGCGVLGSGYQQQTDALQAQSISRQNLAAKLRGENAALRDSLASLSGEEQQVASQLINANNAISGLERRLLDQQRQQEITQAQFDLLSNQLDDLAATSAATDPQSPQARARIQQLEADVEQLSRDLE